MTGIDVFEPPYEAHQLRLTGMSWSEVARNTGYANAQAAASAVKFYLQQAAVSLSADKKRESLDLELERLDALQKSWWGSALNGDEKAANVVLRCMSQRAKILGLELTEDTKNTGQKTILVMGANEDYARALKEIAESKDVEPEDED